MSLGLIILAGDRWPQVMPNEYIYRMKTPRWPEEAWSIWIRTPASLKHSRAWQALWPQCGGFISHIDFLVLCEINAWSHFYCWVLSYFMQWRGMRSWKEGTANVNELTSNVKAFCCPTPSRLGSGQQPSSEWEPQNEALVNRWDSHNELTTKSMWVCAKAESPCEPKWMPAMLPPPVTT